MAECRRYQLDQNTYDDYVDYVLDHLEKSVRPKEICNQQGKPALLKADILNQGRASSTVFANQVVSNILKDL